MILSAQTIRKLCLEQDMISPFIERQVINGRSAGLSGCSYDVRIKQDIRLYPIGAQPLTFSDGHKLNYTNSALASTVEKFNIPENISAFVVDKSSFARVFLTAFNTLLDPGWSGFLTLELVNLGSNIIDIGAGDPICQIVFQYLDQETELPYKGKYANQPDQPVDAIYEK